jgi:hypothetical protein
MKNFQEKKVKYHLNDKGDFVIENYNSAKPFANFFPGIAGKYGIPMWVFYVNRGQAISSFGTRGKGHAILEFFPANKSWQLTPSHGFRTFIKLIPKNAYYEPFHNGFSSLQYDLSNSMSISPWGLTIEETNRTLGLSVKVEYFNIPNDNYAGLARIVTIKNTGKKTHKLQLLDGLPQIVPYGTNNMFLKNLGRTIEAWMHVENMSAGVPFFKLSVDPTDRPEVIHIKEGNFYLGFSLDKGKPAVIKPIVDPECVFGPVTDFSLPHEFVHAKRFKYPTKQITDSKMPSSFIFSELNLKAGEEKSVYEIIGTMHSLNALNSNLKKMISEEYLCTKQMENKLVVEELLKDVNTESSSREFDLYTKQTYLDNIMRGGYPEVFKFGKSETVFYLYSRKHGDLERDYNRYVIQPTYFSQGNGNYRDINQNRRCDAWFNPEVKDENLVYFFNLLQIDGFNPLIVKGANFIIKNRTYLETVLKELVDENQVSKVSSFLRHPFTPGSFIFFIEDNKINLHRPVDEVVKVLLSHSIKAQEAEHGEGFWTDHWSYNLDLLDNFSGLYPEALKDLVFNKKVFTFYDNPYVVMPRSRKYTLYEGKPRQLKSVVLDSEKLEFLRKRPSLPNLVRTQYGKGDIYETTLINKLVCLLTNKLASLDPSGAGIEMEAGKPNWYDALNGLPALFGSSLCETFELKRLILFLREIIQDAKVNSIKVNEETASFLFALADLLKENTAFTSADKDFIYWDKSYSLKEAFREQTKFGFSGKEVDIETKNILSLLELGLSKVETGIAKSKEKDKDIHCSYFLHEVTQYEALDEAHIKPAKFVQKKLPYFLEGQVHSLRLTQDEKSAASIHQATRKSALFDKELQMYKVTAPLGGMPEDIGRGRVFTPGWLENESIWLHMEYKYLLELLKCGLFEDFYADFKNTLIPFQKAQNYGRSILENSSFLVSSAFPDKKLHGNGFVARLSGSTAEFLQMWLIMNVGKKPFSLDGRSKLQLRFDPALAGWLFKNGKYSFNFLRHIRVTYYNPKKKDTFGKSAAKVKRIVFKDSNSKAVELNSESIPSPYAEQIRSRLVKAIDIHLG